MTWISFRRTTTGRVVVALCALLLVPPGHDRNDHRPRRPL